MTQIISVDIGGTHARFALTEIDAGRVVELGEAITLKTAEHASFQTAWEDFGSISRFEALTAGMPVKLITHPQPGLFGAAAAYAQEYVR